MKKLTIHNPCNLNVGPVAAAFLGDKHRALKNGEEVQLVLPDGRDIMFAEVLNVWSGPMTHAPAMLLEMTNDPLQRTFAGLFMHLMARRDKQETKVAEDSVISIVVMRPKQSTLIRPTNNQIKGMMKS